MKKLSLIVVSFLAVVFVSWNVFSATGEVTKPSLTASPPTIWEEGNDMVYKWTAVVSGTQATDDTATVIINGLLMGAEVQEATEGDIETDFTLKLLDARGRDVLDDLFTDDGGGEAEADSPANRSFRNPIDRSSGGRISVSEKTTGPVYLDISSAGDGDEITFILRTKIR